MSEVGQLSENLSIVFRWTSAGVITQPTPAPTATITAPNGTSSALTLTLQGSGATARYVATVTESAAGLYEILATTTDASVDASTFQEFARIGQTWIQYLDAAITSVTPPTVGAIADAVWDEALAGHLLPGSTGEALDNAGGGGVVPTVQQIVDGVWDEANASHVIAGSTGANLETILAQTALITAGGVVFSAPVNPNTNDATIVRGDDYKTADGRSLDWTNAAWTPFSLTTATSVTFRAKTRSDTTVLSVTMSVVSDTHVRLELTSAQTTVLATGRDAYVFDVQAVLANTDTITLVLARMTVLEDVR